MSILHRQRAFVQMDLIAESGPIYMEIQTGRILHTKVFLYIGNVGTECSCHSLGDSVNALKTEKPAFVLTESLFNQEKTYCEIKISEEV